MKYSFLVFILVIFGGTVPAQVPAEPEVLVCRAPEMAPQEVGELLDIDKLQEEFVTTDMINHLEVKPPAQWEIWLRIVGLPVLNAFVAVRKSIRETWARLMHAVTFSAKNHE